MGMNSMEELHPAIMDKLRNDSQLMSMVEGIFDDVPQGQKFPFIRLGEITESPANTFGRKGRETTITIDIYSRWKGFKEAQLIYSRLDEVLDGQPLDLPSFHLVYLSNDGANPILGPDDITRHIPVQYAAMVQEGG